MRGLNLKEIISKSNMNQQGLNIATYGQVYPSQFNLLLILMCVSLFTFCLTVFSLLCFYVTLLLFYLTSCLFFFKCLIFVFYCENTPWVKTIDALWHKRLKMDLKIGSINVRALGDQVKRREIFNWLRAKKNQYILFKKCTVQKTIRMIGCRMGLWSFIQLLHQC